MRILFITPYLSIDQYNEFCVNKTGFGYMVSDIANALGEKVDVDVYATDSRGEKRTYGSFNILKRNLINIVSNLHHCVSIAPILKLVKMYNVDIRTVVRLVYYWLSTGYMKKVITESKYDLVHIHDLSISTPIWIQTCDSCHKQYLITLHALKSFSETIRISEFGKKFERDFFEIVSKGNHNLSVLSSGMKEKIEDSVGARELSNIDIVPNAQFVVEDNSIEYFDIREKYGLDDSARIILCVGNISKRKNQHQLIKAFELLPEYVAANTYIFFIGGFHEDGYDKTFLTKGCKYISNYVFCGAVEKKYIRLYYTQANAVALISKSEAFGLSLIEGMHYGLPCMMYCDMEAYKDIFNKNCSVGIKNHTDESVAKSLDILLSRNWDKQYIIDYSSKFSPNLMSENYITLYNKILNKN